MERVELTGNETIEECKELFLNKLYSSNFNKNSNEYQTIKTVIDVSFAVIKYKMTLEGEDYMTRGFWDKAWRVVKCVGGTVGSTAGGALAGAAVGTVTLPVIGTVSGTSVGAWSGALVGIASFC